MSTAAAADPLVCRPSSLNFVLALLGPFENRGLIDDFVGSDWMEGDAGPRNQWLISTLRTKFIAAEPLFRQISGPFPYTRLSSLCLMSRYSNMTSVSRPDIDLEETAGLLQTPQGPARTGNQTAAPARVWSTTFGPHSGAGRKLSSSTHLDHRSPISIPLIAAGRSHTRQHTSHGVCKVHQ